ncbi:MAG TPA: hypothetical protein VE974_04595 [Thermoanaerobaculia bacterium]|nr:hypothetical protein [Thermoanaerobaculia bacterium]
MHDRLEARGIECSFLDELQQARLVFCATRLQRDRGEVFGAEHPRPHSVNVHFDGLGERFLTSGPVGGRNCTGQPAIITYSPSIDQPPAAR